MATRVVMPKLTDTMEEGVVLGWKKHEGDQVAAGDVLAEIETDKAVMDLEAFGSGTLRKILADEGQTVKSGALIALIAEPDEDIDSAMKALHQGRLPRQSLSRHLPPTSNQRHSPNADNRSKTRLRRKRKVLMRSRSKRRRAHERSRQSVASIYVPSRGAVLMDGLLNVMFQ